MQGVKVKMLDQQFANMANLPFIFVDQCFLESKNRKKRHENHVTVATVSLLVVQVLSLILISFLGVNATKYTQKLERFPIQLARTSILEVYDRKDRTGLQRRNLTL